MSEIRRYDISNETYINESEEDGTNIGAQGLRNM